VDRPLGRLYGRCIHIRRVALDPVMFGAAPEYPAVHFTRTVQAAICYKSLVNRGSGGKNLVKKREAGIHVIRLIFAAWIC